jgi:opacity protein-like surface antigen
MKQTLIFTAVVALCGSLATPAIAADTGWHLRVFAAGFDPTLDETVPAENPEFVQVTGDSDLGFGLSLEYQFSRRWGLEAGFMKASPDVKISGDVPGYGELVLTDAMSATALLLEVDCHLIPDSRVFDVYLGAGIARMSYQDLSYEVPEDDDTLGIRVGNETTWSAKAGIDIALGASGWSAIGGLRYIDSDLVVSNTEDSPSETETFDYGILNFFVGIGYSF